jgi:hypothetical protein
VILLLAGARGGVDPSSIKEVLLTSSVGAARRVFAVHAELPVAAVPKQPVLFYNPKSGGGKAERFQVAREARPRGVEPVELHFGEDLETRSCATRSRTARTR